jgi:hypothetical protein
MNVSMMQFFAAVAMVGIAIALLFAYRSYLANNSERGRCSSPWGSIPRSPRVVKFPPS